MGFSKEQREQMAQIKELLRGGADPDELVQQGFRKGLVNESVKRMTRTICPVNGGGNGTTRCKVCGTKVFAKTVNPVGECLACARVTARPRLYQLAAYAMGQ